MHRQHTYTTIDHFSAQETLILDYLPLQITGKLDRQRLGRRYSRGLLHTQKLRSLDLW